MTLEESPFEFTAPWFDLSVVTLERLLNSGTGQAKKPMTDRRWLGPSASLTRASVALLLLAGAACGVTGKSREAAGGTAPLLELRLAYDDSSRDRDRHQYGDTVVYLERSALLTDTDIVGARPVIGASGVLYLDVRYAPAAAAQLASGLSRHIGGRLGLVLASRLRTVVAVASGAGALGHLTINTGVTGIEAEQIAARIRARWPAR